jgi:lipopolysaccharide biosynthesis glycosyltransferase
MPRELLDLMSAADAKFFPGLITALGSALGCASGRFAYRISVLDGGIQDADWSKMEFHLHRIARAGGTDLELIRIRPSGELAEGLPSRRGSQLAYARLLIPSLTRTPKLVYIDSDVVCMQGVEAFFLALDSGAAVVAVRDPLGKLGRDSLLRHSLPRNRHGLPYFNTGIIGINADAWRETADHSRIEQLLPAAPGYRYADQSLLNLVFHGRWHELPENHNRILTLSNSADLERHGLPGNLHYVGRRKPWLSPVSSVSRSVADRLFDRAHHWVAGAVPPDRTLDSRSQEASGRKSRLYRIFYPPRGRLYAASLAAADRADEIAGRLWDARSGPRNSAPACQPQLSSCAGLQPYATPAPAEPGKFETCPEGVPAPATQR